MTQSADLDARLANLLTATAIAQATGHSVMCVYRALHRLDVKPAVTIPHNLYDPSVVDFLKSRMRKPRSQAHV